MACKHGCGRSNFQHFKTCCTRCRGPQGPHAADCETKTRRNEGVADLQLSTTDAPSRISDASDEKLYTDRKCSAPGKGFKAKLEGRWRDYAPACETLLRNAYMAKCPSMRLNVRGHMYKFDFEKMQQKNLNTLEVCEMRAPHDLERPVREALFTKENLAAPFSRKVRKSLTEAVAPQRPIFVVRVPKGGPGHIIQVPHPKKLGKAMNVSVPQDAHVGQALFVPVPRTEMMKKLKYGAGGAAAGAGGAAGAFLAIEATEAAALGGGAAIAGAGGVGALAAGAGPVVAGGAVVLGVAAAAGAAVHYATKNPGKAVAIGALTIGGLAFVDHVGDVGVVAAAGDLAEGAGDLVAGAGDAVETAAGETMDAAIDGAGYAIDAAEDIGVDFTDAGEWSGDTVGDGVDIILDLF